MKRRIWGAVALLLLSSAAGTAWAQEAALPAEAQQILKKLELVRSYKGKFSLEAKEPDGQLFQLEGTLLFSSPNQRRLEMRPPGSKEEPQLLVSDGKTEWQYDPIGGMVYRVTQPVESPGPHRPFSETRDGTVRFVSREKASDGSVLRFEAEPRPESVDGAPVPVQKIRIDAGEADGLVRELSLLDDQGNPVMTQRFFDIQVNVPVADKEFVFVPKQGMAVVDLPVKTPAAPDKNAE